MTFSLRMAVVAMMLITATALGLLAFQLARPAAGRISDANRNRDPGRRS